MMYGITLLILLPGLICASSGFEFLRKPKIVQSVNIGDDFVIDCTTNGTNVTTELLKFHSGNMVPFPSPFLKQIPIKKDGDVYTLLKVGFPGAGQYKCRATENLTGQRIEWPNRLYLIPTFPSSRFPTLSVAPKGLVNLQVGESKNISCQSGSNTYLTWYKVDGRTEYPVPANKIWTETGPAFKKVILEIKQAKESDTGSYKCVLDFKTRQTHEIVTLTVLPHVFKFVAPKPSNAIHPIYINIDNKLKMNCTTTDPKVTPSLHYKGALNVKWRKLDKSEYTKSGSVYTIPISIRSKGHFKCVATNSKGDTIEWPSNSGIFIIPTILQVPEVTVSPNYKKFLIVGESFDFTCSSKLHTDLKWFKIGADHKDVQLPASETSTRIIGNTQQLILMIRNATKDDSGLYKCVLNFAGRQRYEMASLDVYDAQPPNITGIKNKDPLVKINSKVTIGCIADGYPKPIVEWFKDGKPINIPGCALAAYMKCDGSQYTLISKWMTSTLVNSSLTIHQFNENDTVYFTCQASNKFGHVDSEVAVTPDVFRFLKPKPKNNIMLQNIMLGETFSMDCTTSDPNATSWLLKKDGLSWKTIPKTGKSDVYDITQFSVSDAGGYKCVANNSSGYKIEWPNAIGYFAIPDLYVLPKMSISPIQEQYLSQGDSLIFTCTAESSSVQLKWFREVARNTFNPVPGSKTIKHSGSKTNQLVLRIEKANVSDSGLYKCEMSYRKKMKFVTVSVKVFDRKPPRIISHTGQSSPIVIKRGVLLECVIESHPKASVRWYKDGKEITVPGCQLALDLNSCTSKHYRIKLHSVVSESRRVRSALKIKHFDIKKDAGEYTCKAFNVNGETKANMRVGK